MSVVFSREAWSTGVFDPNGRSEGNGEKTRVFCVLDTDELKD